MGESSLGSALPGLILSLAYALPTKGQPHLLLNKYRDGINSSLIIQTT
jgi:hypothetical protein